MGPLASFLCPPGYTGPTGLRAIAQEGSAFTEAAHYFARSASDGIARLYTMDTARSREPAVDPVILVPGFMSGDGALGPMAWHLRSQGYRTYRSMMYANVGCTQDASDALEQRIETIATRRGRKVTIIGHSLGGVMARGIAARRPDLVAALVTLGSPILAPGAAHPVLKFDLAVLNALQRAGLVWLMGEDCASGGCARRSWEQAQVPLVADLPFTSVYSRRDGIVDWRSCLDSQARPVEVPTSHYGMAFDPRVLDVVTRALEGNRRELERQVNQRARLAAAPEASAG